MKSITRLGLIATISFLAGCSKNREEPQAESSRSGDRTVSATVKPRSAVPENIPEEIRKSLQPEMELPERIDLIRALPETLSEKQLEDLFVLLSGKKPEDLTDSGWRVIANEILETLRHRQIPGLAEMLTGLASDRSVADAVIRDYSLQHYLILGKTNLEMLAAAGTATAPETVKLTASLKQIFGSADSAKDTILGTGFAGIESLARDKQDPQLREALSGLVAEFAVPLIGKPVDQVMIPNAISAVRAAAYFRIEGAEQAIRELAFGNSAEPSIRLNGVYALRYYSNPADLEALRKLSNSKQAVRHAAADTVASIEQAHSKPSE